MKATGAPNVEFVRRVLPWPRDDQRKYINVHFAGKGENGRPWMSGKPTNSPQQFLETVQGLLQWNIPTDIYFCLSRQRATKANAKGKITAAKSQGNATALRAIWLDIDVGKLDSYSTREEALTALGVFISAANLPLPSAMVGSGGGLHVYWLSDRELTRAEWQPYADGLKALGIKHELLFDAMVTADSARILRVPGTFNRKKDPPRPVELLDLSDHDYDFSTDLAFLREVDTGGSRLRVPEADRLENSPAPEFAALAMESLGAGIERETKPVNIDLVAPECGFIQEALETGGRDFRQPLWNYTCLLATATEGGREDAHRMARGYPRYSVEETDEMFDRKLGEREANPKLAWVGCKAIQAAGCKHCAECPNFGKVKSPLNLASPSSSTHARAADPSDGGSGVTRDDFSAYMPQHNYIYRPTREPWPASSVDARLGSVLLYNADGTPLLDQKGKQKRMSTSTWLDQNKPVEQMTWAPGLPMLIRDRLVADGGWIERPNVTCLNLYRPPKIIPGDATAAGPWVDHIRRVFGDDTDHIVKYLAHRVQHPEEKVNHALVLGGSQGIGKDTILEPVKQAIGPWNFSEVSPQQLLGRFNGFLKSVILRVSEARDLGEVNRFQFYDHMKSYIAAPPDVLRVDEKNLREHNVLNCCGVIITTNHKVDGIYLAPDDRRHFVAWSELTKEDFDADYWKNLYGWYENGGSQHVAAYLARLYISSFDAKAPPPKTAAFWDIVDANRAPEDAELADILDRMGNPDAATLMEIRNQATGDFGLWLRERKNRRAIPHRLETCGYVPVRNGAAKDGLWVVDGSRQAIYARNELSVSDRSKAASNLAHPPRTGANGFNGNTGPTGDTGPSAGPRGSSGPTGGANPANDNAIIEAIAT